MVNIAIVEDSKQDLLNLQNCIKRYFTSIKAEYTVTEFADPLVFLSSLKSNFDLIFMDIEMPFISGMEAAKRLRKIDEEVMLVFVTNMANYALESYSVHAYDFILKPIDYESFFIKIRRIYNALEHKMNNVSITLSGRFITKRIEIADILYVEVCNHDIIFHLKSGEFRISGTMRAIKKQLDTYHFVSVSASFLINLRYVSEIRGEYVHVGCDDLKISRSYRKEFFNEFTKYVGGSV